jgi:predicted anti-sigma-YlaC factor YlaD
MDDHERLRELVGAHALRSLPPDEAREVVEHLQVCAECRDLLAELVTVAGELALAAPPVPPPGQLLSRLRRSIAAGFRRWRPRPASWPWWHSARYR